MIGYTNWSCEIPDAPVVICRQVMIGYTPHNTDRNTRVCCDLQTGYDWLHCDFYQLRAKSSCDLQTGYDWLHF